MPRSARDRQTVRPPDRQTARPPDRQTAFIVKRFATHIHQHRLIWQVGQSNLLEAGNGFAVGVCGNNGIKCVRQVSVGSRDVVQEAGSIRL